MTKGMRALMVTCVGFLFTGCVTTDGLKTHFSDYSEPENGPRARLRVMSDRLRVSVYPGAACQAEGKAGAGFAPGTRGSTLGPVPEPRRIGMPRFPVAGGRFVTEMYVRAGEPVTFSLGAGGCVNGLCPVDRPACTASRSFIPADGSDYLGRIVHQGASCEIDVYHIEYPPGPPRLTEMPSEVAEKC